MRDKRNRIIYCAVCEQELPSSLDGGCGHPVMDISTRHSSFSTATRVHVACAFRMLGKVQALASGKPAEFLEEILGTPEALE